MASEIKIEKSDISKYTWRCIFPYCTFRGSDGLHKFPANYDKKVKWMAACRLTEVKPNDKICNFHFDF